MHASITLVILAGGRSSRMGRDKALVPFLGEPIIRRIAARLAPLAEEILVATGRRGDLDSLGLQAVEDLIPDGGALGGLYTGIASARNPIVAVVACDMPFASLPLFETAVSLLHKKAVDIVVPHSDAGLEPLHAVYRKETCLPVIERAIRAGKLKIVDFFPSVRVCELALDEIRKLDPLGRAFININTPAELERAERMA